MKSILSFVVMGMLGSIHCSFGVVVFETDTSTIGNDSVYNTSWQATSFSINLTTSDYTLDSVRLYLDVGSGSSDFSVSIWDNTGAGSTPGSLLAGGTLTGENDPTTLGWYEYTPLGTVTLAANTTYWVVASVLTTTPPEFYSWAYTSQNDATVGQTQGIAYSINQGISWTGRPDLAPNIMQVNATAVPEPHEYALVFGLGLAGFAAYRRFALKTS